MWPLLLLLTAGAADPSTDSTIGSRSAEFLRLSEEIDRAATRANWLSVERLYGKILEIGQPLTFPVQLNAARSAEAVGDTATMRARLHAASQIREDKQVLDWLWRIQTEYGTLMVAADLPANYRLEALEMPFNPEHRRSVEFASRQVIERSMFEGLLPMGRYRFAPLVPQEDSLVFEFEVKQSGRRYDIRSREPTRRDRARRARIDRRLERG